MRRTLPPIPMTPEEKSWIAMAPAADILRALRFDDLDRRNEFAHYLHLRLTSIYNGLGHKDFNTLSKLIGWPEKKGK